MKYGGISESYAHIIGLLHRGLEVEVFKVKADKARNATRQDTVNDDFDKVKWTGWCTYIVGVADLANSHSDAFPIGILLMMFNLADNHGVTPLFSSVLRYIFKLDDAEGFRAFHSLVPGAFWSFADFLA